MPTVRAQLPLNLDRAAAWRRLREQVTAARLRTWKESRAADL